jgi:hypothetical protein
LASSTGFYIPMPIFDKIKTFPMIFNKRKMKNPPVFTLSDEVIEIVDSYSYHGLVMNYNGSVVKAKSTHTLFFYFNNFRNSSRSLRKRENKIG